MSNIQIDLKSVSKSYGTGENGTSVLENIDFCLTGPMLVAIMGPSGSGKTTLLNLLCGIDKPCHGLVSVMGANITDLSPDDAGKWRRGKVGYVFQDAGLIDALTCEENVELPLLLGSMKKSERKARVSALLEVVDIGHVAQKYPTQLSRGQEQRVAVARSLAANPKLLVCDEPTGNLDRDNAIALIELLKNIVSEFSTLVIMATHDQQAANYADSIFCIKDKAIQELGI